MHDLPIKVIIADEIGLTIDKSYPWKSTFFGLSEISPSSIFNKNNIANNHDRFQLPHCIWLERTIGTSSSHISEIDADLLASKVTAVTLHEVMDSRLKSILALVSGQVFDYDIIFTRPNEILKAAMHASGNYSIKIPLIIHISKVPTEILRLARTILHVAHS